jgi:hypothetical protein
MKPGHVPLQTRAFDTGNSFFSLSKMDSDEVYELYFMKIARARAHTQARTIWLSKFPNTFPLDRGKAHKLIDFSPAAKETITKGATALKKDFKGVQIRS